MNLPVNDLEKSKAFFSKLGFPFNPQFSDDKAMCMIVGEDSFVMLLVEDFFKTFTKKAICDATKSTESIIALSAESRAKVKEIVEKAVRAGGKTYREPDDQGWMYGHSFQDLDGHQWELIYMDESKIPKQA